MRINYNLIGILAFMFMLFSCTEDNDGENLYPQVVAEFGYALDHLNSTVTFNNASTGADRYLWDFGDGTTSEEANPEHQYAGDGTYTVTLTATNTVGHTDVTSYEIVLDISNICDPETEQNVSAENLNITFASDPGFTSDGVAFDIVTNPNIGGINTSCNLGRVVRSTLHPYVNSQLVFDSKFDFSVQTGFTMKVYSPAAGSAIVFKLEDKNNAAVSTEVRRVSTAANTWEEFEFYFGPEHSGLYDKIVIFFDLGLENENTFYFDDIQRAELDSPAEPLLLPITFENQFINYAFGDFGNAFATKVRNPDQSGINTSSYVARVEKMAGAETWAGSFLTLSEPINFNSGYIFKMKVWSPRAGVTVLMKFENLTDGGIAHEVSAVTSSSNVWEELTFDFSDINTANSYQKIVIFMDFGNSGDGSVYYFDDISQSDGTSTACVEESASNNIDPDLAPVYIGFSNGENPMDAFGDMSGSVVANPLVNSVNNTCNVYRYEKSASGQAWAGIAVAGGLINPLSPATQPSHIKMKVLSESRTASITVRLEFMPYPDVEPAVSIVVPTTQVGVWEELDFDFSEHTDKTFKSMVIYVDEGAAGDDSVFYLDEIQQQ